MSLLSQSSRWVLTRVWPSKRRTQRSPCPSGVMANQVFGGSCHGIGQLKGEEDPRSGAFPRSL